MRVLSTLLRCLWVPSRVAVLARPDKREDSSEAVSSQTGLLSSKRTSTGRYSELADIKLFLSLLNKLRESPRVQSSSDWFGRYLLLSHQALREPLGDMCDGYRHADRHLTERGPVLRPASCTTDAIRLTPPAILHSEGRWRVGYESWRCEAQDNNRATFVRLVAECVRRARSLVFIRLAPRGAEQRSPSSEHSRHEGLRGLSRPATFPFRDDTTIRLNLPPAL